MKKEDDLLVYDEDEAVAFILESLPEEMKKRIGQDEVDYVLDVMVDYYDSKGYIDEDSTEEATIDEDEMYEFIEKAIKKDKMDISEEEIDLILQGEYEYGVSIGIYTSEEI
jgi:hypothetical protein